MISELRSLLEQLSPSTDLSNDTSIRKLAENLQTLFIEKGMLNSIVASRPLDRNDRYLPWYTYPALDYFNQLDFSNCNVIEFGSGYSTLYWSDRARSVISIERDENWYNEVSEMLRHDNVELRLIPESGLYFQYLNALPDDLFDVIIVDGRQRYQTMLSVHQKLRKGGMLMFDNSDWYPESCAFLRNHGFTQIDFAGFGPINNYTWCTSVFINENIDIPHNKNIQFIGKRDVVKEDDGN